MKFEYCKVGCDLYKYNSYIRMFINPKFNKEWYIIDEKAEEAGFRPDFDYEISEKEALEYALSLGMSKKMFYKIQNM